MKLVKKFAIMALILLVSISFDQITKNIARKALSNEPPQIFLNDTFRLEYAENNGAFLSLGSDLSDGISFWTLRIIPLAFMAGLLGYMIIKINEISMLKLTALSFVVAGGLSNLVDRFLNNRLVVDFMNIGIGGLRSGIFNFADVSIVTGVILLAISFYTDKAPSKEAPESQI